ncbi:hypothetical protein [Natrialba taiwanensis]|uniref:hypothetical protein n=1 Tax=Natrialba taiwanensis TaxID=160846 RepID=UPI00135F11B3|nr:hypothetical protein [Natrialba taiwanensis]
MSSRCRLKHIRPNLSIKPVLEVSSGFRILRELELELYRLKSKGVFLYNALTDFRGQGLPV